MATNTTPRTRGRPKGSTSYREHDAAVLMQAGDLLFAAPTMTTRAAICQALGHDKPAAVRRLQRKFGDREVRIEAGRLRAVEKERQRARMSSASQDGSAMSASDELSRRLAPRYAGMTSEVMTLAKLGEGRAAPQTIVEIMASIRGAIELQEKLSTFGNIVDMLEPLRKLDKTMRPLQDLSQTLRSLKRFGSR